MPDHPTDSGLPPSFDTLNQPSTDGERRAQRRDLWGEQVHSRLSGLHLSPAREHEIVEELAQHLEDRWRELVTSGAAEDEAVRLALGEFQDGNVLAQLIAPLRQAQAALPVTP